VALLLAIAAVAIVVSRTLEPNGDDGNGSETTNQSSEQRQRQNERGRRRPQRANYRVKLNDTLGLISEKTGVPVERLQLLNPELDPQNLVVGQRIKLRE
jgi:LysM repeat protein